MGPRYTAVSARGCRVSAKVFRLENIYSQVGLITLVGLVSKNGILNVEFANNLQEQGKDKLHAVIEEATTRLRPILMTTAATVMGLSAHESEREPETRIPEVAQAV